MSANANDKKSLTAPLVAMAGLALAFAAWSVPVNLKSLSPALLREAGAGTPSVAQFGRQLVDSERIGPATLTLAAARSLNDPGAESLATALARLSAHTPEMVAWGGWDPFLDPLFNLHENKGHAESTPVLTFFITEKARDTLRAYLANSRCSGGEKCSPW